MEGTIWLWIGFNVFVLFMLALDLGVFHRHSHVVSTKEAAIWSVVWIGLAMLLRAFTLLDVWPRKQHLPAKLWLLFTDT
jgi:hypothetical protein